MPGFWTYAGRNIGIIVIMICVMGLFICVPARVKKITYIKWFSALFLSCFVVTLCVYKINSYDRMIDQELRAMGIDEDIIKNRKNKTTTSNNTTGADRNSDAWICAKDIVESNLKSPTSAKFCSYSEATIQSLGNNKYKITGYVDADNTFGASMRNDFTVTLTLTKSGYTNGSVSFD